MFWFSPSTQFKADRLNRGCENIRSGVDAFYGQPLSSSVMTPRKISEKNARTNIYISEVAMANLKKLSEQHMGAPVAELIRRAIDEYVKAHLKKS